MMEVWLSNSHCYTNLMLTRRSWRWTRRGPLPKARIVAEPEIASVSEERTGERETASRRLICLTVAWAGESGSC